MAEKRKDNKGRVLQKGESQRKDGTYQYRYSDMSGNRHVVYAKSLNELREKEKEALKLIVRGGDYSAGNITVGELLDKYINLKNNIRVRTRESYIHSIKRIKQTSLADRKIRDVKMSTIKEWVKELYDAGVKYSTIACCRNVLRPAFQMAVDEDVLAKNPFEFKLSSIISDNGTKRRALFDYEQEELLRFIRNNRKLKRYYDEVVIFLETGVRASEMSGITLSDIKFDEGYIDINKQLFRDKTGKKYISKLKTDAGYRKVPITENARTSLENVIKNRKCKNETIVDGCSKFLFLGTRGAPKLSINYETMLRQIVKKYNEANPDNPMINITPHVLRHTYCTNLVNMGLDVKAIQYLMGHSDIQTTLNIYAHNEYDKVMERYNKIIPFNKNQDVV